MNFKEQTIKSIQESVNAVLATASGIEEQNFHTDDLLNKWFKAKGYFINCWKGELIWEYPYPVCLKIGDKAKHSLFTDFLTQIYSYNSDLYRFLNRQGVNAFYSNKTEWEVTGSDGKKICVGSKLIKAFKHFEDDPKLLDMFQTRASMMIQEDKVEGTLCLSVHPLDYLSSSENTYNWRSCHALNGDYAAGNLSYMLDNSTVVCYIKGADGVKIPRFPDSVPWNSKKWRMLMYTSENKNVLFAGRQYPFFQESALEVVLDAWDKSGLSTYPYRWTRWYNEYIEKHQYPDEVFESYLNDVNVCIAGRYYELHELIKDNNERYDPLHYNDLIHSTCYTPYYTYNTLGSYATHDKNYLRIGTDVKCPCCGMSYISESTYLTCPDCYYELSADAESAYCDCCGNRFNGNEGHYVGQELVCQECWDTEVSCCSECGEAYYSDDLIYDRDLGEWICSNCFKEKEEED